MQLDDELEFGMTKLIIDDEEEQDKHSDFDEEFMKPTTLIDEEELPERTLPQKRKENESPEIRLIKLKRKEPEEEYLFSQTKLDLDDDELDNESNDDEYLFKPAELVYEDPLEIFNKKREQTQNLNPLEFLNNTSLNKEKDSNIKKDDEVKMEEKNNTIEIKEQNKEVKKMEIKEPQEVENNKIEKINETAEGKNNKIQANNISYKEGSNASYKEIKNVKQNNEIDQSSPKHFIDIMRETIEKGSSTDDKYNNKTIEKPQQNNKYIRFRSSQNKEPEKDSEKTKNVTTGYKAKYSRYPQEKEKPVEKNEKEKTDNIPATSGYRRRYFIPKNEQKEEKPEDIKDKKVSNTTIVTTTINTTGYGYGRRRSQKEEPEKDKKEQIKTEKPIENILATSKYGGRFFRTRSKIEGPKKEEKEPPKIKVDISKYIRHTKVEEKPKEEPSKFGRGNFL